MDFTLTGALDKTAFTGSELIPPAAISLGARKRTTSTHGRASSSIDQRWSAGSRINTCVHASYSTAH